MANQNDSDSDNKNIILRLILWSMTNIHSRSYHQTRGSHFYRFLILRCPRIITGLIRSGTTGVHLKP